MAAEAATEETTGEQTATTQNSGQSTEQTGTQDNQNTTGASAEGQTSQEEQTGETGADAEESSQKKGDKSVALRQEREKRREEQRRNNELQQELQRLRQGQDSSSEGSGESTEGDEELELSDEDMDDPEALKSKVDQHVEAKVNKRLKEFQNEMESSQEASGEMDRILKQYEIFTQEDDPYIRQDAIRAAADAVSELPSGSNLEDAEQIIDQVAKRYDGYRAKRADQGESPRSDEENQTEGPATVGTGTAESAHYTPEEGSAGSMKEADRRAKQRWSKILRRNTGS